MFRILFLLFIVVPIIEIMVLMQVGSFLGAWPTIGIVILTAWFGAKKVREQGLATEAVNTLLQWAYSHDTVKQVVARTPDDRDAAHRVLEKAGFVQAGHEGDVIAWTHERSRLAA